jgi:hypothetical protein
MERDDFLSGHPGPFSLRSVYTIIYEGDTQRKKVCIIFAMRDSYAISKIHLPFCFQARSRLTERRKTPFRDVDHVVYRNSGA